MILRFEVQDQNGKPATDVEPYMGMAAHAEIVSSDLQVFAHIHPSGSVPMAALMMVSSNSSDSMAGMNMSDMNMNPGANAAANLAGTLDPLRVPRLQATTGFFYSSNAQTKSKPPISTPP